MRAATRAALGVVLLALVSVLPHWPYRSGDHDMSSHATFEYYWKHHFRYGKQVFQNTGPYGFIHYSSTYVGLATREKIVLHLAYRIAFVLLFLGALGYFRRNRILSGAWILGLVLFWALLGSDDAANEALDYATAFLGALHLLHPRPGRRYLLTSTLVLVLFGFMSLVKHSLFMLAGFSLSVAAVERVRDGDSRDAGRLIATFLAAYLTFWLAASQRLGDLPGYLRGVAAFSRGYNETMAFAETPTAFWCGVLVLSCFAAASLYGAVADGWRRGVARTLVEAAVLFTAWKHGFVRADNGHTPIFFGLIWLIAPLVCLGRLSSPRLPAAAAYFALVATIGVWINLGSPDGTPVESDPERYRENIHVSARWLLEPRAVTADLERELRGYKREAALPRAARVIGFDAVDQFGWTPGWVLLNGLRYSPRPMPMSFAAATPFLQRANEDFYRDAATAPRFVLVFSDPLDDHLLAQEDARAFNALMMNYRPVLLEKRNLLLERLAPPEPRPVTAAPMQNIGMEEAVSLAPFGNQYVWANLEFRPTLLGSLVSFLYKSPRCYIHYRLKGHDDIQVRRLLTGAAPAGFLISPLVEDNNDWITVFVRDPALQKRIEVFYVECGDDGDRFFDETVGLRLQVIPGPPLPLEEPLRSRP
jgi:hypothetical protein